MQIYGGQLLPVNLLVNRERGLLLTWTILTPSTALMSFENNQ